MSCIARRLAVALSTRHALVPRAPRPVAGTETRGPFDTDPFDTDLEKRGRWDTDLVLRVTTADWYIFPFRFDWDHYRLAYKTNIELYDSRGDRVLASGECEAPIPEDPAGAPTYGEMTDGPAAVLKQKLDEAAVCSGERMHTASARWQPRCLSRRARLVISAAASARPIPICTPDMSIAIGCLGRRPERQRGEGTDRRRAERRAAGVPSRPRGR